ncbi:MAG: pseudouridine synthase [Oligoflexales bacterium]
MTTPQNPVLQKWMAERTDLSRRAAEQAIQEGRVKLNQTTAKLGDRVSEDDAVWLDGDMIRQESPSMVYWVLNKPDQLLSTFAKEEERPTLATLPAIAKLPFRVWSVGRLDYRTEGLLILTNDGQLAHNLSHPSFHIPRHYQVLVNKKLTPEDLKKIRHGFELDAGKPPVKCKIDFLGGQNMGATTGKWYRVTVHEGRNRLVRRVIESCDRKVIRLIRDAFGEINLPTDLAPGKIRAMTPEQIRKLKHPQQEAKTKKRPTKKS